MQLIAEAYDLLRYGLGLGTGRDRRRLRRLERRRPAVVPDRDHRRRSSNFKDDQGGRKPLVDAHRRRRRPEGHRQVDDAGGARPRRRDSDHHRRRRRAHHVVAARDPPRRGQDVPAGAESRSRPARRPRSSDIRAALYASKICSYAQGFVLLAEASRVVRLRREARARWRASGRAGASFRAVFLDRIRQAFETRSEPRQPAPRQGLREGDQDARRGSWRKTVQLGVKLGIGLPAMSASLAYFDSLPARPHARQPDPGPARLLRRPHLRAARSEGHLPHRVVGRRRRATFSQVTSAARTRGSRSMRDGARGAAR